MFSYISKNIFLIDDDTEDQEFFIEAVGVLKNVNITGVANNGKEALGMLANSTVLPDIIFMDFNMPLMSGVECLNEIKKPGRTKDISVYMLSSAFEQAETARKFGARGFVKKSSDITTFRTELYKAINLELTITYLLAD